MCSSDLTQRLHLLNSSHIQRKLEQGPRLKAIFEAKQSEDEILDTLYLTMLARRPTPAEREIAKSYVAPTGDTPPAKPGSGKRREDWLDLAWALLNSDEFLYRH